jgi:hypothetical protein
MDAPPSPTAQHPLAETWTGQDLGKAFDPATLAAGNIRLYLSDTKVVQA